MTRLFSPLKIRDLTLKNRIVMSPMCQYSATNGLANDWHFVHYGTRAVGGAGLIVVEATAVLPEGRITPGDLGLWNDEQIPGLKRIVDFIHAHKAHAAIQLAHAGRKASCALPADGGKQLDTGNGGWQTVAPSSIPFQESERKPAVADRKAIDAIISAFTEAAGRALKAGFDVVEIHSAHGYLLHEFLSPLSNKRDDMYGGSFENRTRLLVEVSESIRKIWPSGKPLFARISSTDWTGGGWTPEESIRLAGILKTKGVDLIDCSSGGNVSNARIPVAPGYQVPFAEEIRETGIMTGAVGLITSAQQAESILSGNKSDLIFLGRELLRNPYFPLQAAKEMGEEGHWPGQYIRSR